jgi:hypothetical protein
VAGYFEDRINFGGGELVSQGNRDIYLLHLSAAGAHVFSKSWGRSTLDYPTSLSILPDGDVLMSGTAGASIDFGDGDKGSPIDSTFLVRFSPQGVGRWSKRWNLDANSRCVAAAPDGTLWFATDLNNKNPIDLGGGPRSSPTGYGLLTAHFSGTGAYLDSFILSSSASSYFNAIAIDSTGQLVAGGMADGDVDFGLGPTTDADGEAFFFKQSGTGLVRWAQRFGATHSGGIHVDAVEGIAISPDNHVLVAGTVTENIKLGTVSLAPHSFVVSLTP